MELRVEERNDESEGGRNVVMGLGWKECNDETEVGRT